MFQSPRRHHDLCFQALLVAWIGACTLAGPARALASEAPVLGAIVQLLDEDRQHVVARPRTVAAVTAAAQHLEAVDAILARAMADGGAPPDWARRHGTDGLTLLTVFNLFNEVSEEVEAARRLETVDGWASDAASQRYRKNKLQALERARRHLAPGVFAAFRHWAGDGAMAATFRLPWQRRTGPRYGYDIGRFYRAQPVTGVPTEGHTTVQPWPWIPASPRP